MSRRLRITSLLVLGISLFCCAPASATERTGLQEWGLMGGYGAGARDGIFQVALFGRAAWAMPEVVAEPLRAYDLDLKWSIEGWVSAVFDGQDAFEGGFSPFVFKLDYEASRKWVPFGIAGVGALYTGLRGQGLGGPFEFGSFVGFGVHYFVSEDVALTLSWRLRHISNAGMVMPNRGLNTNFVLIGIDFFPRRAADP